MNDPSTSFLPLGNLGAPIQTAVMPIVAKIGNSLFPAGTGFVINSEGLMMTASHVLRFVVTNSGREVREGMRSTIHSELYAIYNSDEPNEDGETFLGGLLPIDKAWFPATGDVGLCWLRVPQRADGTKLSLPVSRLSPGLPRPGDPVAGVGYRAMEGSYSEENGKVFLDYQQESTLSTGTIIEIYPVQRDEGFLNFPCFRTTAHFAHGMSGGPVYKADGSVCGVISGGSSFDPDGYAALIYFAFGCSVEIATEVGATPRRVTLYELAQAGHLLVDETFQKLSVVTEAAISTIRIRP